jgi:hypothetical protein
MPSLPHVFMFCRYLKHRGCFLTLLLHSATGHESLACAKRTPGGENEDKHVINSTLIIILKCLYSVTLTTGNSYMNTVLTRLLLKRLWKDDSITRLKAT